MMSGWSNRYTHEIVLYLHITTTILDLQDLVRIVVAVHSHVIIVELHAVTPARRHKLAQLRADFSDHIPVVVNQARTLENHLLQTVRRRILLQLAIVVLALRNEEGQRNERFFLR